MNNNSIGVFDSGIGGATVLKEIIKILPNENYIFYSDSIHNPYGDKSDDKILEFCDDIVKEFLDKNDTISLNSYLENQKIEKKNLNDALCLCLQKYILENKKILEFIDILLKNGAEADCHFHYIIKTKNLYPKIEDKDNVT